MFIISLYETRKVSCLGSADTLRLELEMLKLVFSEEYICIQN